jgi:hypothetical protein
MGRHCGGSGGNGEIAAQRIKARARRSGQLMFHQSGLVPEARLPICDFLGEDFLNSAGESDIARLPERKQAPSKTIARRTVPLLVFLGIPLQQCAV